MNDAVEMDNPWEDLVVAILAVNQYSLEKTYLLLPGLRKAGLTDAGNLSRWTQEELLERLKEAGCDRGSFMTALFAQRLCALGALIQQRGVENCNEVVAGTRIGAIEKLLLPVKGIGPKVLKNFYALRQLE